MPDAQGVTSFIGEFLKGYMAETTRKEQQKYQDLSGVISVAEKYRAMAEDPRLTKEEHNHWKQLHAKTLDEADKILNQKSSGLGSIMKIFGIGKKQANGATSTAPSEWYKPAGGDQGSSAPTGPAPMPRPAHMGPEPNIPNEMDLPPEFRGMQQYMSLQPASSGPSVAPVVTAAKPEEDKYADMNPIRAYNERIADLAAERRRKEAIQTARETGEINQEFARENAAQQQTQNQQEIDRRVALFKSSPQYKPGDPDSDRIINSLQLGLPYKEPTPYRRTVRTYNDQGEPVTQVLENGKIIDEAPTFGMANESIIRSIMDDSAASGKPISYKQAEAVWGKHQRDTADLTNKAKTASIANQASNQRYRQLRIDALAEKKKNNGAISAATATSLYKAAQAHGLSEFMRLNSIDAITMTDAQKQAKIDAYSRQYIEGSPGQEGIMKWDDLRRVANPAAPPPKTAEERARAYTGPKPVAKPGSVVKLAK
jgi:hypothetical protein